MIPNFIFDEFLELLTEGELKILLAIYRKTVGFDKTSDKIPYSQLVKSTGLSKSTISKGIKGLVNKKLVKVDRSGNTNRYTYCLPKVNMSSSSKPEPMVVQNSNQQLVRNSNTQKKVPKETEKNTTNSSTGFSDEVWKVINYWNEIFSDTLDPSNAVLIRHIERSISQFSVNQIKEAIFRRSNCSYYKRKKPELLNKPNAFFPYPETIRNDLNRNTDMIFDYDEKNERVYNRKNKDEDFEIIRDMRDKLGRPLWKLKNAS
ncbi:replication protein [Aliifodinibius sp. S!AR15-10]|uniref:replication protein n=1 Tax=Aliifodinibius sp. S!AR15-10 TaxID=2950437 RepID=UPI002870209E|nr:replication protein [Aliifodinibius sp. S!AR15-10]